MHFTPKISCRTNCFSHSLTCHLSPLGVQFVRTKYIEDFVHILQCWLWKTQTRFQNVPLKPKVFAKNLKPRPATKTSSSYSPTKYFSKISFETSYLSLKAPVFSEEPPGCSRSFSRTQLGFARGSTVPVTATGSSKSTP